MGKTLPFYLEFQLYQLKKHFILKYKLDQDKSVKEKNTLKIQYLILNFVIPML